MTQKVGIIVQARMGSTRFPRKAFEPLGKTTVFGATIQRALLTPFPVYLAIPEGEKDDELVQAASAFSIAGVWRGDEMDVRARFHGCAAKFNIETIVRLTADCPLVDPKTICEYVEVFDANPGVDYVSSSHPKRSVPHGLDVEVFSYSALNRTLPCRTQPHVEHVTPCLYTHTEYRTICLAHPFPCEKFTRLIAPCECGHGVHINLSVDRPINLELIRRLYKDLPGNFSTVDVVKALESYL